MKKSNILSFSFSILVLLFLTNSTTGCKSNSDSKESKTTEKKDSSNSKENTAAKQNNSGTMITGLYQMDIDAMMEGENPSEEEMAMAKSMMGSFTIELLEDEMVKANMMGQSVEGTYQLNGKEVVITIEGDPQTFKIEGARLVSNSGGQKMIFVRK